MADSLEVNCPRTVHHSKYEHDDPEIRNWWYRTFESLEAEVKIPPEERPELIKELLPDLAQTVLEILGLKQVDEEVALTRRKPAIPWKKYIPRSLNALEQSVCTTRRIKPNDITKSERREAGANNPYLRFFKRGERAAIWRKLPPLSLEEMNLTQKAEAMTETIAEDFVEWLRNIGGDEEPTVDVPTIIKLFEIGFNYHAATSLCVRIKEMPAVTDAVAEKRNLPEASLRVNLHKQLASDLKSYKQKQNHVAFGKMLPPEMRTIQPKEDFVQKWLDCKRVPQDLATMATVWEGIENLRSTRAFCGWLLKHPEIKPPEYLVQKGMLDAKYLLGPHYSIESFDEKVYSTIGIFNEE